MVREQVVSKRLKLRADITGLIAEESLDGDRAAALGAEAMLAHFFD